MQNIPTMQSNLDIKQHFAAVNIVTRRQNSHFLESIMTPSVIKMSKKNFLKYNLLQPDSKDRNL